MADPFVAEVRIFPFNFAPRGWAWCNGQLLPISQNTALFSLLGTTYGGNGRSNFALPNLQGRAPMHPGQGPGLSLHALGESEGSETVQLLQSQMPAHSHALNASAAAADEEGQKSPGGAVPGVQQNSNQMYGSLASGQVQMSGEALATAGGGQPHNNMMPYLTFYFNIALQGVFPPRS
jgi:microcystin-dependent protein